MCGKQILLFIFIIITVLYIHTIYVYVYNMHFCSNQSMLVNWICQAQLPTPILPPFYFRVSYQTWASCSWQHSDSPTTSQVKEHIQIGESEVGAKILSDACLFLAKINLASFGLVSLTISVGTGNEIPGCPKYPIEGWGRQRHCTNLLSLCL